MLFACNQRKVVHYRYHDVTDTRMDGDGKTYLFYGPAKKRFPTSYIFTRHVEGFSAGMECYLVFCKNGNIGVVNSDSNFERFGDSTQNFIFLDYNPSDVAKLAKIKGSVYDSIVKLWDVIELEKKENLSHHSNVDVAYIGY